MGAIGGMLGLGGGQSGTGFKGPEAASPINPINPGQTDAAYTGNQQALDQQSQLLAALKGQGGVGNQSQVYNQLQNVVAGKGPNPAATMLNTATGQNIAQQAALQAGQRGANANVGLMARNIGQQGAATQQQAVGQGATLQANQALNALGQAGNMANTQVGQQIGATTANTQAQQSEQQQLLNALQGVNTANVGMQSNINTANMAGTTAQLGNQAGMVGGLMNTAGTAIGALAAEGGEVACADGADISGTAPVAAPVQSSPIPGATSGFGKFLKNWSGSMANQKNAQPSQDSSSIPQTGPAALNQGMTNLGSGIVKALGGAPAAAAVGAKGGDVGSKLKKGGKVPGTPKVGGAKNSYDNDIVDAKLSPGEIVLPRSVTMSSDPVNASMKFVQAVLAKRKMKGAR